MEGEQAHLSLLSIRFRVNGSSCQTRSHAGILSIRAASFSPIFSLIFFSLFLRSPPAFCYFSILRYTWREEDRHGDPRRFAKTAHLAYYFRKLAASSVQRILLSRKRFLLLLDLSRCRGIFLYCIAIEISLSCSMFESTVTSKFFVRKPTYFRYKSFDSVGGNFKVVHDIEQIFLTQVEYTSLAQ